MEGIGIRATEEGGIAIDIPGAKSTIEMSIEDALDFATKIGEVAYIAVAQRGQAIVIDQAGKPRVVNEDVVHAIDRGMNVVLGGELVRPPSADDGDAPSAGSDAGDAPSAGSD